MVFISHFGDTSIETLYWSLMEKATKKKLTLRLEKHFYRNELILYVQIFPTDRESGSLYSGYSHCSSEHLFREAENFIKNYKGS